MSNYLMRLALVMLLIATLVPLPVARACPFCSATQQTISEEMAGADAAVIVKLAAGEPVAKAEPAETTPGVFKERELKKTPFEIIQVLKGEQLLGKTKKIEILYFGQNPPETKFLVMGTDPKDIAWSTPTPLSDRAVKYVSQLPKLPETGPERLVFFQEHFEDADSLLANDSFDEFAKAPYAEVQQLKPKMHRDKLIAWIKNPNVASTHRRLYLTMLGVCGQPEDISTLEELIRNEDRQIRQTLDAMLACYLNLKGPSGMPLVEDMFLKNAKADYVDTYAAIMALRFHGQETSVISRERLTEGLRHMLDRPKLADLVIPDLARWEDWSCMERLVKMFKDSVELAKAEEKDAATGAPRKVENDLAWVRVPIVRYLAACPLPEAKTHLEELRKLDPESVKSATQFFPLGSPVKPPPSSQRPKNDAAGAKPEAEKAIEQPSSKNRAEASPAIEQETQVASAAQGRITAQKPIEAPTTVAAAGATKRTGAIVPEVNGASAGIVLLWSGAAAVAIFLLQATILRGNRRAGIH
jgi:hypothetical protein